MPPRKKKPAKKKGAPIKAAPPTNSTPVDDLSRRAADSAIANLEKQFGKGCVMRLGDSPLEKVQGVVSTGSVSLDRALGVGGLPYGRVVEVLGPESSGKTTLALQVIANAQKKGAICAFVDAEHALDIDYAAALGVDTKELLVSQPDCGEQALEITEQFVSSGGIRVIVVDSVAALTPRAELEGDMGDHHVGLQARLMSQALRKLTATVHRNKAIIIFINQIRCVAEDTLVFTEQGLTTAKEATKSNLISGFNGQLSNINAVDKNKQPAILLKSSDGRFLKCGYRHPLLVCSDNGVADWEMAANLEIGDWVAVSRHPQLIDVVPNVSLPKIEKDPRENEDKLPQNGNSNFCAFLGTWFADGSILDVRNRCVTFTEVSTERKKILQELANKLNWHVALFGSSGIRFGSRIQKLLKTVGCRKGASNKVVPTNIIKSKKHWRMFLRYMFDTHPVHKGFMITVNNRFAAHQIQTALLGFGINSRLNPVKDSSHIYVSGVDALKYIDEIGFSEPTKECRVLDRLVEIDHSARGKADVIPNPAEFILAARETSGWASVPKKTRARLAAILCAGLNISVRDYLEVSELCQLPSTLADHRWVRVSSVEYIEDDIPMIDFDVDGDSFVANGFVTHNTKIGVKWGSPETTTGGNALKFYSSVRLDIRRIGAIKQGEDAILGNRTRVKVVKNKVAPPFRKAEFDIMYGKGISLSGDILDLAVAEGIVEKSGAWYSWDGDRIGQGRENSKAFLEANPEIMEAIQLQLEK